MEPLTPATIPPAPDPPPPGWAQPYPAPVAPPRRGRWHLAILPVLLVLAGAAGGVYVAGAGEEGASFPEVWDPRVTGLVEFVAAERGLPFLHPVHVDFLTDEEFVAEVTSDESETSAEDREEAAELESLARALGFPLGDDGLTGAGNTLAGEGILAYYSHEMKRVTVRGTETTVARKVTLVHELTHVLQDQHFDLSRAGSFETDAQDFALKAIVEGDAVRIENAYLDKLSEAELAEYEDETNGPGAEESHAELAKVPSWLTAFFGAPYALGEPFVTALVELKGRKALDDVLRDPPASEEAIYNITKYLAGDHPEQVRAPKINPGDREIDRADFGSLSLMLMLAERLPALDAVRAGDDWGGDAYVAFERDGKVCARIALVGDTTDGTDRLAGVLERWAADMPAGSASVSRTDGRVDVLSCDAGSPAPGTGDGADDVMTLLVNRSMMLFGMLDDGLAQDLAACVADEFLARFTTTEIAASELPADFERRMTRIGQFCASSSVS